MNKGDYQPLPWLTTERSLWLFLLVLGVMWLFLYKTIAPFWDWVFLDVLGLPETSRLTTVLHFFFFDISKILLLLSGIIFVVAIIRSFFSVERTRALLSGRAEGIGNIIAALLGVVTPFCSCSAVPAFIGFVGAGVPLGVTFSFLIASPMINEVAIVLLYGSFGLKIALIYVFSGLIIAILAGFIIGKLKLEKHIEAFVFDVKVRTGLAQHNLPMRERVLTGFEEVKKIISKIWPYLLIGMILGATIHGLAPEDIFLKYAGPNNPLAVLIAVALGVPLYSNAAGILPVVTALHEKGVAMGTVLAFMQSVVALSLPEMILLRQVLKPPLITTFILISASGIIIIGYLFNLIIK